MRACSGNDKTIWLQEKEIVMYLGDNNSYMIEEKAKVNKKHKPTQSVRIAEPELIGRSEGIRQIRSTIERVADSPIAVLISGESGTGKEVVAALIHQRSSRRDKPFIAINCAALPEDILENELFGHEQGAFTGATGRREGNLEMANGGTIFFDELGEMAPNSQAKLLRALETKSFRRLGGGQQEIRVDIRTLAATGKDVQNALKSGTFRQDLYYRLSAIEIHLPPLRERKEDISMLADNFLLTFCAVHQRPLMKLSPEALDALMWYEWPGNVRELRNVIERTIIMSSALTIAVDVLPERISGATRKPESIVIPLGTSLREVQWIIIQKTLALVRNNKSEAARMLGLSRKTLHKKLTLNKMVEDC